MRKNNIALYIAVGLAGFSIVSFWICINQQIIASLSIATLLFTIAQTIESKANYLDEDMQNAMDISNKVGNFNFNDEAMALFKAWMKYDTSNENNIKKKCLERSVTVINSLAFMVLFAGFTIPIEIPSQINTFVSILSTSLLFFSIWLLDKQQQRKEQWNEVWMLFLLNKNANQNIIPVEEEDNGQTTHGNP